MLIFTIVFGNVGILLTDPMDILLNGPGLKEIAGESPNLVARRAKNLGDILIHSEFTKEPSANWLYEYPRSKGMFSCNRCQICPFVDRTATFSDTRGRHTFEIRDLINCSSNKVIYMLTYPCPKIYIGKTKRSLKTRIGEHIREIKGEKERDPEKSWEKPLAKHFALYHRGKPDGLKVKDIYLLKLSPRRGDFNRILLQKEKRWIYRLGSLAPHGLNTELNLQVFLET